MTGTTMTGDLLGTLPSDDLAIMMTAGETTEGRIVEGTKEAEMTAGYGKRMTGVLDARVSNANHSDSWDKNLSKPPSERGALIELLLHVFNLEFNRGGL
jgi:hypothetical protein